MRERDRDRDVFSLEGYKPEVTLTYKNSKGEVLDPKEAFRIHSHVFHGKG